MTHKAMDQGRSPPKAAIPCASSARTPDAEVGRYRGAPERLRYLLLIAHRSLLAHVLTSDLSDSGERGDIRRLGPGFGQRAGAGTGGRAGRQQIVDDENGLVLNKLRLGAAEGAEDVFGAGGAAEGALRGGFAQLGERFGFKGQAKLAGALAADEFGRVVLPLPQAGAGERHGGQEIDLGCKGGFTDAACKTAGKGGGQVIAAAELEGQDGFLPGTVIGGQGNGAAEGYAVVAAGFAAFGFGPGAGIVAAAAAGIGAKEAHLRKAGRAEGIAHPVRGARLAGTAPGREDDAEQPFADSCKKSGHTLRFHFYGPEPRVQ